MVAEGSVDICAEPELSLWDMAANAIIVDGGGRRASPAWTARPGPHGGNAAASNGLLHDELLGYLRPALLNARRAPPERERACALRHSAARALLLTLRL